MAELGHCPCSLPGCFTASRAIAACAVRCAAHRCYESDDDCCKVQSRLVWEAMAFKIMVGTTHPGYSTDMQVSSRGTDECKHCHWLHASTTAVS